MTAFPPASGRRSRRFWRRPRMSRLKTWALKLLLGKGVEDMAVVYATLIIKGKKTLEQVKDILTDLEVEV